MHATSSYTNSGSKVAKIAIVSLLHAAVAVALISMRIAAPPSPKDPELILVDPVAKAIPPDPPRMDDAPPPRTLPPIYVPPTIIVDVPRVEPTVTTTTVLPTHPEVMTAGPKMTDVAPPAIIKAVEKPIFHAAHSGDCAAPNYPANSARNGDAGTVGLALLIAADGHVADAKVTSTSGFRELDRAAIAALSLCKFKPATANGVPESAWGKIAYVWTLEG